MSINGTKRAVLYKGLSNEGIYWTIASLGVSLLPQLKGMTFALLLLTVLPILWRLFAQFRKWRPIPIVLRVLATAIAVAVLVLTYGGLVGRRTAITLLSLMLSLKLLETFRTRDARIIACLSLFLCATQFLFAQGVLMVFYMIACLLATLIALTYLQRWEAVRSLGKSPGPPRGMFAELGFSARMLVLALPVGIALFLLFPRWGSPLWGVPEEALDSRSGLSDSMSPGSIQNLFMDDSPAFRVQFDGAMPRHNELYWRGPVFWNFNGKEWSRSYLSRNLRAMRKPDPKNAAYQYTMQIEPTEQRWLFALDYPAVLPPHTHLSLSYELLSNRPVTQLRNITVASDPDFTDSPKLKQTLLRAALELPPGFNPRTAAMMAKWRAEEKSDTAIVRRALAFFNRENFHYTLNPPLLSNNTVDEFLFDTRKGFCEHYASAFTVMMRMAGIPARVVTGYQGGWYNDLGAYLLVRQSDAHAWSEVWVRGAGWTRIDPTAAVAPGRVEEGALNLLAQRRHLLDFGWLRNARNTFDVLQRGWNDWVIAFNHDRQSRLFTGFGWGLFDANKLVAAMVAVTVLITLAIYSLWPVVSRFRTARKQDRVVRLWRVFSSTLRKAGAQAAPWMAPKELAAIAGSQLRQQAGEIDRIAELYTLCRYSPHRGDEAELEALIKRFHPRPAS
ncbi:MAG: DUF3488 and transglutaminase-like domain-containing protein [Lysobacterales bacterium]|jgi:transglutaminase-like putative cysteine protease